MTIRRVENSRRLDSATRRGLPRDQPPTRWKYLGRNDRRKPIDGERVENETGGEKKTTKKK